MAFTRWTNNFTGGEWSPLLDGRCELAAYGAACRRMENMRPMVHGGAVKRGGLEFVGEARTGSQEVRLIAFQYSTVTRYVIEVGNKYFRIRRGQDGAIAVNVLTTPYVVGELFELQFRQGSDIMYIVHPSHAPKVLKRYSDTSWALEDVLWSYPPLLDENVDEGVRLACSAMSGTGVTLTASGGGVFNAGHVGGYFELRHFRQGSAVELTLTQPLTPNWKVSEVLAVRGDWEFTTTELWWGQVFLERSRDGGATWEVVRRWSGQSDRNISTGGRVEDEDREQLMRINYQNHGDPYHPPAMNQVNGNMPDGWKHAKARLEVKDVYARGLVRVTGYSSPTSVTVAVVKGYELVSTGPTDRWSEGAWSVYRGYPRAVGFYEQRMLFAGTSSQPIRLWGSKSGDFENFKYGAKAEDAFGFDIAATEGSPIVWIDGMQRISLGTTGGEFTMSSGSAGEEPLSPTSVAIRGQSSYGSRDLMPVRANEALIFVQRQGRKLREFRYSIERDGFVAPDLTLSSEHIFRDSPAVQLAFVRAPDPMVVVATGEHLGVLTYDRESEVTAWSRYVTQGGIFESVCGLYGDPIDEVWCVVRRKVGTQWKRFIERFAPEAVRKADSRYLDCHRYGALPSNWNGGVSVGGHLEGELLRLMVGGVEVKNTQDGGLFRVISGGIHVPDKVRDQIKVKWAQVEAEQGSGASGPLRSYCVGLPYRALIETMRLEAEGQEGASAGKQRRVLRVTPRFWRTGQGVRFGPEEERLEEINFRQAPDAMDDSPPLFTGDVDCAFAGGYNKDGRIVILQENPLPFTLLGMAINVGM